MRNEAELAKKNLEIGFEFSRLVLGNPTLDDQIPENALVVFEVADDPELTRYNRELAQRNREANQPIIVVHIQGLAPTRLLDPHVSPAA